MLRASLFVDDMVNSTDICRIQVYGRSGDGGRMGRRQGKTGFDALAALPWPVGIMAGVAGFFALRDGIPWWFSRHEGALSQAIAQQAEGAFAPMAWILLLLCWLAALASFLKARHRRRLLDTRTTLESLAAGGWHQFELLVGEAFRRQGHAVEETGLGGADGGSSEGINLFALCLAL